MNLKYQHFFEALPPKISPEKLNIWFSHPSIDAEVNEFGEARSTIPDQVFYDTDKVGYYALRFTKGQIKGLYKKTGFLFCCYHQTGKPPRQIFYLDGNPYNFTKSNLIGLNYAGPDLILPAMLNTHAFIENTVQKIPEILAKYSCFWSEEDTVENLKIPTEYMEYYLFPEKMEKLFDANKKSVEKSIRRRIYRSKNINYGI